MKKAWASAAIALVIVAGLALRTRRPSPRPTAVASATASSFASPQAPPSARSVRHDGVSVAITGGGVMRETAPFLAPDTEAPDAEPRPVTVILHALCADERWMCDWLQYGDLAPQWQICPRAPNACGNGGAQWTASAPATIDLISRAIDTTKSRHGDRVGDALVLVGMSQGAYAIAHVVHELATQAVPVLRPRGIVLHGARVTLSASELNKLSVRVVLAAGDQDGAAETMRALALSLKAQGVEARWASFGPVGHFLPVDAAKTMAELVEWARGRTG